MHIQELRTYTYSNLPPPDEILPQLDLATTVCRRHSDICNSQLARIDVEIEDTSATIRSLEYKLQVLRSSRNSVYENTQQLQATAKRLEACRAKHSLGSDSEKSSDTDPDVREGERQSLCQKRKGRKGKIEKSARPDKIAFYRGDIRSILNHLKWRLRVYLATVEPFPAVDQVLRFVRKQFPLVSKDVLGRHEGTIRLVNSGPSSCSVCVQGKLPKLTEDMEKMVGESGSAFRVS